MKFYIASKLENAEIVSLFATALKAAGHIHTYDWTEHGSVQNEDREHIAMVAEAEKNGVIVADMVIVILPGGRGTHVELGMALASGKKVIICAEHDGHFQHVHRTCAFYWNPGTVRVVGSMNVWLKEILAQAELLTSNNKMEVSTSDGVGVVNQTQGKG